VTAATHDAPALILRHVPWEGAHRIGAVLAGKVPVRIVDVLEGQPLPPSDAVAGAVVMGGPMSVNDTAAFPDLAREVEWLQGAIAQELPLLGVCLGSQLIARSLGAEIGRAARPEIGFAPVRVCPTRATR
jgi:GMP synthase (glutamine-hydrolysing)